MNRLGWGLVALLAASCAWESWQAVRGGSGFATMPIFVPVSLEYEVGSNGTHPQSGK